MWESTRSKVKVLVAGVIVAAVVCCVVQLHVMEGDGPKVSLFSLDSFVYVLFSVTGLQRGRV